MKIRKTLIATALALGLSASAVVHAVPIPFNPAVKWRINIEECPDQDSESGERASTAESTTKPKNKAKTKRVTHKVRYGDTLYGLSLKYRTTVDAIRRLNSMTRLSKLIEYEIITVLGPEPCSWRVKKNQNLYQISEVTRVTFEQLLTLNPQINSEYVIKYKEILKICSEEH